MTSTPTPTLHERVAPWLWAVVLPVAVVLLGGFFRFYRLGQPDDCYFDETYYYYDAREYLTDGVENSFAVHPPVGKWLIAGGLAVFGVDADDPLEQAIEVQDDNCLVEEDDGEGPNEPVRAREAAEAFARRFSSALFGTLSIGLTYLIGVLLFRRRSAALLGAALLAMDGLAITMSRISMLDIFLQFFTLLAVWLLLLDRERLWRTALSAADAALLRATNRPPVLEDFADDADSLGDADRSGDTDGSGPEAVVSPSVAPSVSRPNRVFLWASAAAFGLAVATKWSGLAAWGLGGVFAVASEVWWMWRHRGVVSPRSSWFGVLRILVAFTVVPAAVYLASYAGWFVNFDDTRKADRCAVTSAGEDPCADPLSRSTAMLDGWWEEQNEIFRFHRGLDAEHPYRASAWTWLVMSHPVAYYYESCPETGPAPDDTCLVEPGNVSEVLGMGNPFMWWLALLSYPWLFVIAVRRRSWPAMTVLFFLFGQIAPYFLFGLLGAIDASSLTGRPVFLFYTTPIVPFIAMTLAAVSEDSADTLSMRWVPYMVMIITTVSFLMWMPVFLGLEISYSWWSRLMWFSSWI